MILEQVDLVDIQEPAMRLGEQARLERLLARTQCAFQDQGCRSPGPRFAPSGMSTKGTARFTILPLPHTSG